jgi:hypothetical protein
VEAVLEEVEMSDLEAVVVGFLRELADLDTVVVVFTEEAVV